jgi:hypothetical protein
MSIKRTTYTIVTEIIPAAPTLQESRLEYAYNINIQPIPLNVSTAIQQTSLALFDEIISPYFNDRVELKTLVNFGEDNQMVVLAKRYGITDATGQDTIQVKLLNPLPDDIDIATPVFISREVANTIIDTVDIRFAPEIDATPYLRPKNTGIRASEETGKQLNNITLQVLQLQTGSVGSQDASKNISFEDQIYRAWYSYDFDSAELNLDFSDYKKFIMYGSAKLRLQAFRQKLLLIEALSIRSKQFQGVIFTGSLASAGASYIMEQSAQLSKELEDIIRGFDRYEQYLYFTPANTDSPYSASFEYVNEGIEYNAIGYWPKINGITPYPVDSEPAKQWFDTQLKIAERYDEFNLNSLINTIPSHILAHDDNASYFTFVLMIGHFFDLIKPYIEQFPLIYNRNTNPNADLSKDLIVNIADAVGFKLPAVDSLYSIVASVNGSVNAPPTRDLAAETHKRLLHNLPLFAKSKGTKTALTTAIRTLGIPSQLLNIAEAGESSENSVYVFDEFSNGILFDTESLAYIKIPVAELEREPYPRMIQLSVKMSRAVDSTILSNDATWALNVRTHPTNKSIGRFEIVSGSSFEPILTSSYYEIFDGELVNIAIRTFNESGQAELRVMQAVDDKIMYSSVDIEAENANIFVPLWNTSNAIFVGGTTSFSIGNFSGILDEIRLWGINLSTDAIINVALDPGAEAGDTYKDPSEYLYAQVSFNSVDDSLLPTFIRNESPYKNKGVNPSIELLEANDITQNRIVRYNRTICQVLPQATSTGYVSKKIKIVPPATFLPEHIGASGVKNLSPTRSVVTSRGRTPIARGRNKVLMTTSPTRIINDSIIRAFGKENINTALGIPEKYKAPAGTLSELQTYYNQYYYVNVDYNKYIRITAGIQSTIGQIVEYFIPSKASLLSGIVIEPTYLEQNKVKIPGNLRVYGAGTRKTNQAANSLKGNNADYGATFNVQQLLDMRVQTGLATYNTAEGVLSRTLIVSESFNTYWINHEDWARFVATSESLAPPRQAFITASPGVIESTYNFLDKQHLSWHEAHEVSRSLHTGSIIPHAPSYITIGTDEIPATFNLIDKKHLNWNVAFDISQSLHTGSRKPHATTAIDTGVTNLNKVGFFVENHGRSGADPYNRIYPRKLFEYEISGSRLGGITSLNINSLYDIPPASDFKEPGAFTYFNNLAGVYYFPETILAPRYRNPLNQEWDLDNQEFVSVPTWSYGTSYVQNDVVYQYVTRGDTILGELTSSAYAGNDRYYVFSGTPLSSAPTDGSTGYVDSIPSFVPPSLDGTNWTRLRFRRKRKLIPRRIVFDTFTIPDPVLNNFRTTTIAIDVPVDRPDRYIDQFSIGNIPIGGVVQGELLVQNISSLFAIQASADKIRMRLYRTLGDQRRDFNRTYQTLPTGSHGVLLDTHIQQANVAQLMNPVATLIADSAPPGGKLFYTIENLENAAKFGVTLLIYYFSIEIERRIPRGYLRKHYRFYRDNSTATKRRNYIGCNNTINTTIDGLPPVQVLLGEGTEITVSPTDTAGQIITGGGGTLRTSEI